MTITASIRALLDARATRERAAFYAEIRSDAERAALQLELLNEIWERTVDTVGYFSDLRNRSDLPRRFESLEEFADRVPATDRRTLQDHRSALVSPGRPADLVRITGGSTAEPVQIPSWRSEFDFTKHDAWLARSWYGIRSDSRLFMLWGHSHLLGTGVRGRVAGMKRNLSDRLLGYRRFSAYDLSEGALRRAGTELIRFQPEYVVGYSVALDLFAEANADLRDSLRAVGVKVVVGAAEGFPEPDSEARISDLFGCPVAMEYGAVETGLVGHTHPDGGYRVFWRTYLVETERTDGRSTLRVTSLYPRCVPLVRYEIGDEIELWDGSVDRAVGVTSFERVIGRCNDYVALSDGFLAHSEVITHAVRSCAAIRSYQVVQEGNRIELLYTSAEGLGKADEQGIRERLGRVHAELAAIPFERVDALRQTIAGKTPMIIRR